MMNRIKEFRKARQWSLQKLADETGTSKSQIDKLEKGHRRLTVDWMVRLAKPLDCDPRDLMSANPPGTPALNFNQVMFGADSDGLLPLIPVRGLSPKADGPKQHMFLSEQPIDQVPRPYYLAHARDAYALYVAGDSMAPMYRPRQLLFVNPYKIPSPGGGIVVTDINGAVTIREFVGYSAEGIVLCEYQPETREYAVPEDQIATMHAVVGAVEP